MTGRPALLGQEQGQCRHLRNQVREDHPPRPPASEEVGPARPLPPPPRLLLPRGPRPAARHRRGRRGAALPPPRGRRRRRPRRRPPSPAVRPRRQASHQGGMPPAPSPAHPSGGATGQTTHLEDAAAGRRTQTADSRISVIGSEGASFP